MKAAVYSNAALTNTAVREFTLDPSIPNWGTTWQEAKRTPRQCAECNRMAPSQAAMPPVPPVLAEYPFQCICADYFTYQTKTYLVIVDRYSNWPIVMKAGDGA